MQVSRLDANIKTSLLLNKLAREIEESLDFEKVRRAMGVSRRWLQRKLRGDVALTVRDLFEISTAAGIDVSDLL